jgi:hypothetical protein
MSSKNWAQKKAKKCGFITEIIMPLLFGAFTGWIAQLILWGNDTKQVMNANEVILLWIIILLLTPIMFMNGVIFIMNYMVVDKENKMRETLKIMGLDRVVYGLSYTVMQGCFTLYCSVCLVLGFLITLRRVVGTYAVFFSPDFGQMDVLTLFILVLLFGFSTLTFAQMLSTLFGDSKLASQVGPVIMFFPTTISMLLAINTALPLGHRELCRTITQVLYILPWFPFQVLSLQTIFKGGATLYLGMDVEWAWFALILQPFAYFALYLYFDNVIPNSFGISKECFYCLRCRKSNDASNRLTVQNSRLNESLMERELTDGEKAFDS